MLTPRLGAPPSWPIAGWTTQVSTSPGRGGTRPRRPRGTSLVCPLGIARRELEVLLEHRPHRRRIDSASLFQTRPVDRTGGAVVPLGRARGTGSLALHQLPARSFSRRRPSRGRGRCFPRGGREPGVVEASITAPVPVGPSRRRRWRRCSRGIARRRCPGSGGHSRRRRPRRRRRAGEGAITAGIDRPAAQVDGRAAALSSSTYW